LPLTFTSESAAETAGLGETIGRLLRKGDVLLLQGPLGAGKTVLTQGIARGLGIEGSVTSPTFILVGQLLGRLPLYHVDLYRIEGAVEAENLGLDDYFFGDGVTVVEWPDRAPGVMPPDRLHVLLDHAGDNQRRIVLTAHGRRYEELIASVVGAQTGGGRR